MEKNVKYLVEDKSNDIDIVYLINVLFKRIKLFSILLLAFITVSFLYVYYALEDEYSVSFPVTINKEGSSFITNDLKSIPKFSKSDLKQYLNCTEDELNNLNFIQVTGIVNEDEIHKAIITINSKNPKYIKPIADKIILWVSNNPEVKKAIESKKKSTENLLQKTEEQLSEMKSLKEKLLTSTTKAESNFSFIEEYQTLETKNELTEELNKLNTTIQYTSQFYEPTEPRNKSKILPLFFAVVTSLIFSVLITLISDYKKN